MSPVPKPIFPKLLLVLPLILALSVLSTACQEQQTTIQGDGTPTTSPSPNATPTTSSSNGLKLGTLLPTTGDLSSVGQNLPIAVNLAVDTVNACGGVNDKSVTVVEQDDETDPTKGSAAMSQLAEVDQVAGVVGSFASSVSTAAINIAAPNKIMLVSPGSTSPVFTEQAKQGKFNGYWARTAPPDTYQAQALAALANKKGFKTTSTVVINNDYGLGFEQEFVKAFEKLGGKITDKDKPVRYDPKAATLDSEAAAAFAGQPDAVAAVLYAETGSVLLKAASQQGLTEGVTVLLTDGVYTSDFVREVGKTSEGKSIISGALGTVPGSNGPALAEFTKLWQEKTGKEITAYIPHTWDAAVLMMLAAEAADANTGEGIKSKIREVAGPPGTAVSDPCKALAALKKGEEINYQGASGNVDIDENGDVIGSYDVWTVEENGTLKVIDKINPPK